MPETRRGTIQTLTGTHALALVCTCTWKGVWGLRRCGWNEDSDDCRTRTAMTIAQSSTEQHITAHSSLQQHTATHSSSQQHIAADRQLTAAHSSSQQFTVAHSSSQQLIVAHSSTQQHTAAHSSSQQHTAAHSMPTHLPNRPRHYGPQDSTRSRVCP